MPVEKLGQPGNLKYDASVAPGPLELPTFGARQIWIAASTVGPNERGSIERHETDEDDIVIRSFLSLAAEFPGLLLILGSAPACKIRNRQRKVEEGWCPFSAPFGTEA